MAKSIRIGKKNIFYNKRPFIIAEAGVNHNGNLKTALKLVEAASGAGADAIKFQTFKAEQVVIPQGKMAKYQKKNIGKTESQLKMLKKLELKEDFYKSIINHCKKRKIIFLSTSHGGFESVDFLKSLKVPAFKIGSGDLTNLPLLKYTASFKKPMILGTGMATMSEIKEAIKTIKKAGNSKIIVLHCTTNYPCPLKEVNLNAVKKMIKKLDVLVGYSDHTLSLDVPVLAVAMGACAIEKHFTLNRKMKGPDHKASLEPKELKEMIEKINNINIIMGSSEKRPTQDEMEIKKRIRKSVVSLKNIRKGEKFTKENIGIKRPGDGLLPKLYPEILNKRAKNNIKADGFIKKSHYE
ncbi:MAG: N-acetylneuraminate synthase [Patescibacteria group bacterium]